MGDPIVSRFISFRAYWKGSTEVGESLDLTPGSALALAYVADNHLPLSPPPQMSLSYTHTRTHTRIHHVSTHPPMQVYMRDWEMGL